MFSANKDKEILDNVSYLLHIEALLFVVFFETSLLGLLGILRKFRVQKQETEGKKLLFYLGWEMKLLPSNLSPDVSA